MAHKIQHLRYQISKPNTNVKVTESHKSTFVKTQIKCHINGTKSRDYNEIQQFQNQSNQRRQTQNKRTQNDNKTNSNHNKSNNKQEESQIDIHKYNFFKILY